MPLVDIIGIGLGIQDLTAQHLQLVNQAEILVGGTRHLEAFQDLPAEKIRIGRDIKQICSQIAQHMDHKRIVVLASGDPLFYGIGSVLAENLGKSQVRIHPNITSVAAAFARIKESWSEAGLLSLHGRQPEGNLTAKLASHNLWAVLTDRSTTPAWLAGRFIQDKLTDFEFCVLERLGMPEERIRWLALKEAAQESFREPNLVILKRKEPLTSEYRAFVPGMPDHWFIHTRGLITKADVRSVVLSKLRITPGCTVWDLGAGCGSVGIEAALLTFPGRVLALEKRQERLEEIRENQQRFRVHNLSVLQSDLPEGLDQLPRPHRIFIGGGGEQLAGIIAEAGNFLQQEGIMVVNTVLLDNLQAAQQAMQTMGLETELVQVQVNRSKVMPWSQRLQAQNPVWILQGIKGNNSVE